MSVRLVINLPDTAADLITQYSSGAKLYVLSASSEDGSYSDLSNVALVSGQEQYEVYDAAGTSSTWYKAQVGNSAGSSRSTLSAAFQATALAAYASPADLFETLELPDSTKHNLASDLLLDAKEMIDVACSRTFLRVPQVSGTTTVYFDIEHEGESSLVSAIGHPYSTQGHALDIISVTSLWYRDSETASYVEVAAGDLGYYLEAGYGPGIAGTDWPYEDITLSPASVTRTRWPRGKRAVKLIGVLGFPRVPLLAKRVNVDIARGWLDEINGNGSQPAGINQFGVPVLRRGDPESLKWVRSRMGVYVKRAFRS